MQKNIILTGVGGQGTVLASKLIAAASLAKGYEVMSAETIGMAQRGGSVFSHLRMGSGPHAPLIGRGKADLIIGFEPAETVRQLPFLKPAHVRRFYPEAAIESYTDALHLAVAQMALDPAVRNVLLTHQFVTGAERAESEELNVGGAIGRGSLYVIKDLGMSEPYVGVSPIVSGEIAEDVTKYFSVSEQQSTAVALGVLVDVDYTVKEAGGLIVQVMPDPAEDVLRELEAKISKLKSLTALMEESEDIYEVHKKIFNGIPMKIETTTHPELKCDCSRERMERALISIGKKDLQEIIDEDGEAELVCHFCRSHYRFNKEELQKLLAQI